MNTQRNCEKTRWILNSMIRYWPRGADLIESLNIPVAIKSENVQYIPNVVAVTMPEWARDLAPDGYIIVPKYAVIAGEGNEWTRVDWFATVEWYLDGLAEREHERRRGPVHSYAYRLKGWDCRIWNRAWVNRIALFLRRWAALKINRREEDVFGSLPDAEVIITHDIDATHKTIAIRCKQSVFNAYNVVKYLIKRDVCMALMKARQSVRFLCTKGEFDNIDEIEAIERQYGIRSYINVYGGVGGWHRSPLQMLFDPAYSIQHGALGQQLVKLIRGGWYIGLHQSYKAWSHEEMMRTEKIRIERKLDCPVTVCRQHWLRFSWKDTWKAQASSGLKCDMTLGFNDRPAFRNGSALRYQPWDNEEHKPMSIETIPMVIMDSHLYDYNSMSDMGRYECLRYWINEIKSVRGVGSVVWHPHTLSSDYGWKKGFEDLLTLVTSEKYH